MKFKMWDDKAVKNLTIAIFKKVKCVEEDCDDCIKHFNESQSKGVWDEDYSEMDQDEREMYTEIGSINFEMNRAITNFKEKYVKHKAASRFIFENFAKVRY